MSVLRDSHRGTVPATNVYVYTSNAVCSSRVTKVQLTLNPNRSSNKSIILPWRTESNASNHLFSILADR